MVPSEGNFSWNKEIQSHWYSLVFECARVLITQSKSLQILSDIIEIKYAV